jgi:hypothetical protein
MEDIPRNSTDLLAIKKSWKVSGKEKFPQPLSCAALGKLEAIGYLRDG